MTSGKNEERNNPLIIMAKWTIFNKNKIKENYFPHQHHQLQHKQQHYHYR